MNFWCLLLALLSHVTLGHASEKHAAELQRYVYVEAHLGTKVRLLFYTDDKQKADAISKACFDKVVELEKVLSDYDPKSELSQLCRKSVGEPHRVGDDLFTVIEYAQYVARQSDGAFDVTIGRLSKQWREGVLGEEDVARDATFNDLELDASRQTMMFKKPVALDLGGVGKGYIADQLLHLLKQSDVNHAAVAVGGEIVVADAPPHASGWRVGVENPEKQVVGILVLKDIAISTSGDSYQFFEKKGVRHAHVLDPHVKQSKTNRLNVVTMAPTAMQADAWATALRVLPKNQALDLANKENQIEALFLPYKASMYHTQHFPTLLDNEHDKK